MTIAAAVALPVPDRSVKFETQLYRDLVRRIDYDQAIYLAGYCRRQYTGTATREDSIRPFASPARTPGQWVAYAAYWQSIADAQTNRS